VVERPRGGHRVLKLNTFVWWLKSWLNSRPGGALRWKRKIAGWEGQGVDMWQASTSKVVALASVG
jgi:hypothetical protein